MKQRYRLDLNAKIIISIIFSLPLFSLFATECVAWRADYSKRTDLKVGNIEIITANIFDPSSIKENKFIHRAANKIHIKTKPSTIRNQLLFTTGEPLRFEKILETERNLRKHKYIKSAQITPTELCGKQVNINVKTEDNWTFTPGVSFSHSSGNSRSGIGVEEHNLFGYGKSLSFDLKKDENRTSKKFSYKDPQLFGSRKTFSLGLQDNTDGKGYALDLALPFYEQDSRYAWGISTTKLKQAVSLYNGGKIVNKITEENQQHSAYYGWSNRKNTKDITRFKVGWAFNKTNYLKTSNQQLLLPKRLQESFPWFEFNKRTERYITKTNFKTMDRLEDISLGRSLTVGVGLLHKSLGSDDNQLKLSMDYAKGYQLGGDSLAFLNVNSISYLGSGRRQGTTISLKTEYDHFNKKGNDFLLAGTVKASDNLMFNEQVLLGADMGLRGYPIAYQTGNKSILFQAEKRIHFKKYPLQVMKFGAVFFTDIGTTWGRGNDPKVLADIGFGLRIVPTRSSTGKVIHINLSAPLVDSDKVDKLQFSVKTSTSF